MDQTMDKFGWHRGRLLEINGVICWWIKLDEEDWWIDRLEDGLEMKPTEEGQYGKRCRMKFDRGSIIEEGRW